MLVLRFFHITYSSHWNAIYVSAWGLFRSSHADLVLDGRIDAQVGVSAGESKLFCLSVELAIPQDKRYASCWPKLWFQLDWQCPGKCSVIWTFIWVIAQECSTQNQLSCRREDTEAEVRVDWAKLLRTQDQERATKSQVNVEPHPNGAFAQPEQTPLGRSPNRHHLSANHLLNFQRYQPEQVLHHPARLLSKPRTRNCCFQVLRNPEWQVAGNTGSASVKQHSLHYTLNLHLQSQHVHDSPSFAWSLLSVHPVCSCPETCLSLHVCIVWQS